MDLDFSKGRFTKLGTRENCKVQARCLHLLPIHTLMSQPD